MLNRMVGWCLISPLLACAAAGCGGDSFVSSGGQDGGTDAEPDVGQDVASEATEDVTPEAGGDVISEPTEATLTISPSEHTFQDVMPQTVSDPVGFTVTNIGGEPTGLISVEVGDPRFQIQSTDCIELQPGASCGARVVFAPAGPEPVDAVLVASATPGGEAVATLRGEPGGVVQEGLSIMPTFFDFGPVGYEDQALHDFAVRNIGDAPLPSVTIGIASSGMAPVFEIVTTDCGALEPQQECTVTVGYKPIASEPGRKTATLSAMAGASECTATVAGHTMDVFVHEGGDDNADGLSPSSAVQTITRGLAMAAPAWTVHVMSGTYGPGEVFPLKIEDERLVGEGGVTIGVPQNGPAHVVEMDGYYPELHGVRFALPYASPDPEPAVIVARPQGAAMIGDTTIDMGSQWTGLETEVTNAATVEAFGLQILCANAGTNARAVAVFGNAQAFFDGLHVQGCRNGITIDGDTQTRLRNSTFEDIQNDAVSIGSPQAYLDMGIAGAPGGNDLTGTATSYTGVNVLANVTVFAHGNTWIPGVQLASATSGEYQPSQSTSGVVNPSGGPANYRLHTTGSIIQF